MTTATKITATEAARNFSDILNRAQYRGENFEVTRGGEVVARIEAAPRKRLTAGELSDLWKTWPRLDPDDAREFEETIKDIRANSPLPPIAWDS